MATEPKKIGLYAVAGVSIAALVIAAVFMSGIQLPSLTAETGTLVVLLTDAPVDLVRLNLTIGSFSVLDETREISLPFVNGKDEFYIDNLLDLQNVTETVVTAQIPEGNYAKMRMTIKSATAYYEEDSTLIKRDLRVPPGHLDIIAHFEIEDDTTTVILIDVDPSAAISENDNFRPVLKVVSITVGSS